MKTISAILLALCVSTPWAGAQTIASPSATVSSSGKVQDTDYAVVERGPNHRVLQRISYTITPDGKQIPQIHSYVELASGLNHQDARGQWVESKEEIETFPGGAMARQGQHKVIFAHNLATVGAIDMELPDGQRLRSHVLGLSYFDSFSGKSVMIAEVKDCEGKVMGNQVIYENAFTDFQADVRYTYTKDNCRRRLHFGRRADGLGR